MKTIKGLLGYVGFGVSAIISQGRQPLGLGSLETGAGRKAPPPPACAEETPEGRLQLACFFLSLGFQV